MLIGKLHAQNQKGKIFPKSFMNHETIKKPNHKCPATFSNLKSAVMQIEKALINNRLRVSKVS